MASVSNNNSGAASESNCIDLASFSATPLEPILYNIDDVDAWQTSLKSEGYAVIHNFLPSNIREKLINTFTNDFFNAAEQCKTNSLIQKMVPHDKETWVTPDELGRKSKHAPLHIAQSNFMWGLRTQPNFNKVFSHIHNVNENDNALCASLDSYSLQMKGHPEKGLLLHDDQAWGLDDRSEHYSIQGAYNFYSCNIDDTGLMVVPKSHQKWNKRRAGEIGSRHKQHFVPITPDDKDYSKSYLNAKKLILPKNCFVIWNSKLLHGTCKGTRERNSIDPITNLPKVNRLTCFISMALKSLRTTETFIAKQLIYKTGGTTSHWASHADCHPLNEAGAILGHVDEDGNIPRHILNLL